MKTLYLCLGILWSSPLAAQVTTPTNLNATVVNTNNVQLTWYSPDSGSRISFEVSRATGSGSFSVLTMVAQQHYLDSNLSSGTYSYRVREKSRNRYSNYSSPASVVVNTIPPPPPGGLVISAPLVLDKLVVTSGQTLNGTVSYQNTSSSPITVNAIVIAGRPPGSTNGGGPYDDLSPQAGVTTLNPGATFTLASSRVFTISDPVGAWYSYSTYQDTGGAWHDSASVNFTVSSQPTGDPRPRDAFGWVTCSSTFTPLSDQGAASLVVAKAEVVSGNATQNAYRPSSTELSAFLNNERDINGQLPIQINPYNAYVTGWYTGTTDQVIQWAAIKWGIPPDWLRAEYQQESQWNMSQLGDSASVGSSNNYPPQSRIDATHAYQSLGFSQVKWNHPDVNDSGIGTEPLRWKSTAFNADYQAARVRQFFDNPAGSRSGWGDASYVACQNWLSIGGWFQSYPWNNSGQNTYVGQVQTHLANRDWPQ